MLAVTNTSTVWFGVSSPPTARSSGTVIEIARHSSLSGPTVSSGPSTENCPPSALEASRFVVTI